jgi:hypothetical protein
MSRHFLKHWKFAKLTPAGYSSKIEPVSTAGACGAAAIYGRLEVGRFCIRGIRLFGFYS